MKKLLFALYGCLLMAGVAQADPFVTPIQFSGLSVHDTTNNTLNVASVTNRYETDNPVKFIQLWIQQD